jgi:hypothetical protein
MSKMYLFVIRHSSLIRPSSLFYVGSRLCSSPLFPDRELNHIIKKEERQLIVELPL